MVAKLRVVPKPAAPDERQSESEKLDSQGVSCALKGDLDGALEVFQKALEIKKAGYRAESSLDNLKDISISCKRLATVSQDMGRLFRAFHFYSKSLKIDETLVQKNPSLQNRRDVAADWLRISDLFKEMGKLEKAAKACRKAILMAKALTNAAPICENRKALVEGYLRAVDILVEQGQSQKAAKLCVAAIDISDHLIRENPTPDNRYHMHLLLVRMGDLLKDNRGFEEAEEYYTKAGRVLYSLAGEYNLDQLLRDFAVVLSRLSDVSRKQGKLEVAANFCLKAIKIELEQENQTLENRRDLAIGWKQMAAIVRLQGNHEMALKYYQKALEITATLVRESPTLLHQRDLSMLYLLVGGTLCDQGKFQNALPLHQKASNIVRRMAQEAPTPQNRFCCYLALDSLGMTCIGLHKFDQTLAHFKSGLDVLEALIREFAEFKYIHCYSGLLEKVAVILTEHVSPEAAQAFHDKSLVISKLNPKDPGIFTPPSADDLSLILSKTHQPAAAKEPDQPQVDLKRQKETQKYASIFAAWKGSVIETLNKTEN
jgi:tetratricopeptide (TPR) repeat protein